MRWLLLLVGFYTGCSAPRPIEVRDEGAPRGVAVASATAAAASPTETSAPSASSSLAASAAPASAPTSEEPGIPADASELTRANADFRATRTGEAASLFINAFMASKQSERTVGVKQSLNDAIEVELDQLGEMQPEWLSEIGLEGYCQRTVELRSLPASAANKTRIAAEAKRFCRSKKK